MTGNKAQVIIEKFGKEVPPERLFDLKSKLIEADEEEFDTIHSCPYKPTIVTILLAVFLGAFGADRYYIGDVTVGSIKLGLTIVYAVLGIIYFATGALWLGVIAILVCIAVAAYQITDIFISYKKCRYKNFVRLMRVMLDKKGNGLDDRILEIRAE